MKLPHKLHSFLYDIVICFVAISLGFFGGLPFVLFGRIDVNLVVYILITIIYYVVGYLLWKRVSIWIFTKIPYPKSPLDEEE